MGGGKQVLIITYEIGSITTFSCTGKKNLRMGFDAGYTESQKEIAYDFLRTTDPFVAA